MEDSFCCSSTGPSLADAAARGCLFSSEANTKTERPENSTAGLIDENRNQTNRLHIHHDQVDTHPATIPPAGKRDMPMRMEAYVIR